MLLCNIPGSLKVDITSSFRSAQRQTTEQVGHSLMLDGTLINESLSSYVSEKQSMQSLQEVSLHLFGPASIITLLILQSRSHKN